MCMSIYNFVCIVKYSGQRTTHDKTVVLEIEFFIIFEIILVLVKKTIYAYYCQNMLDITKIHKSWDYFDSAPETYNRFSYLLGFA